MLTPLPKKLTAFLISFFVFFFLSYSTSNAQDSGLCIASGGPVDVYQTCVSYTVPNNPKLEGQCTRDKGAAMGQNYTICCANEHDVCSVYNLREPVCGSADTTPDATRMACGVEDWGLMCWGNNYRTLNDQYCGTDSRFPAPEEFADQKYTGYLTGNANPSAFGLIQDYTTAPGIEGNIMYNGRSYPARGLPICVCGDAVPGGCQCPGVTNSVPDTEGGESRLWFPHLRLIALLSKVGQSLFNPHPSALIKNSPNEKGPASLTNGELVTTKITEHQGHDDVPNRSLVNGDLIVNQDAEAPKGNNSSLVVKEVAPAAEDLHSFTVDPYSNIACNIPEVINNPGDDLLGPKITARVLYTLKKSYTACPSDCVFDDVVSDPTLCCTSLSRGATCGKEDVPVYAPDGVTVTGWQCGSQQGGFVLEDTKGKISPFVKNPLVEYIYDAIVVGKDSLFRRFMPQLFGDQEYEEIPSSTAYTASAISNNHEGQNVTVKVDGGGSPTFYVPHTGSLKKYWLEDFQKAIRPRGAVSAAAAGGNGAPTSGITPTGECVAPSVDEFDQIIDQAISRASVPGSTYYANRVPKSVLKAIYFMESYPYRTVSSYDCTYTSYGVLGLMQISDGPYENTVPVSQQPSVEEMQCAPIPGKLNRCDPLDAVELAARVLLYKLSGQQPQGWQNLSLINASASDYILVGTGYYGSNAPDSMTQDRAAELFGGNQSPKCRDGNCDNMGYGDILCAAAAKCPPYPPRP